MPHLTRYQFKLLIASWVYQFTCFTLLMINSTYLTVNYFKYSVTYFVAPYTPLLLHVPKFSLCVPLSSIFDSSHNKTHFFDLHEDAVIGKNFSHLKSMLPAADDILVRCNYRDWQLDKMVEVPNSLGCSEYFRIQVYRLYGYLCYRFDPPDQQYELYSIINTLNDRRLLYDLVINGPVNSAFKLCPMVHHAPYPVDDRRYNSELLLSIRKHESYSITHTMYEMYTLPPPYATKCRNDTNHHCFVRCMAPTLAKLSISPIDNSPDVDNESLKLVSINSAIENHALNESVRKRRAFCISACTGFSPCSIKLVTTLISSPTNGGPFKLLFSIRTIAAPVTLTKTKVAFTFIELMYQITTLAGNWIGFSVYHAFLLSSTLFTRRSLTDKMKALYTRLKCTQRIKHKLQCILAFRFGLRRRINRTVGDVPLVKVERQNEKVKKRSLKLLSLIIKGTAGFALSVQLVNISDSYFKYDIRTELVNDLNPRFGTPLLAVCVGFLSMYPPLNISRFTKDTYNDNFAILEVASANRTMVDVLDQTWQVTDIVKGCRWRENINGTQIMNLFSRDECFTAFNITRFVYDRHVCFRFEHSVNVEGTQLEHKLRLSDPGIFFSIIFSDQMKKLSAREGLLVVIFNPPEELPVESKDYAVRIYPRFTRMLFLASMYIMNSNSLPAPYVTQCQTASSLASGNCTRRCMSIELRNKMNRVPQSEVYSEWAVRKYFSRRLLISFKDLNSTEGIAAYKSIEDTCYARCSRPLCRSEVIKTVVSPPYRSTDGLEISVDSESAPELNTNVYPAFLFYDFYFLIVSTVTFWTALTVTSFNPFAFIMNSPVFQLKCTKVNRFTRIKKEIKCMKRFLIHVVKLENFYFHRIAEQEQSQATRAGSSSLKWLLPRGIYLLHIFCTLGCAVHLYDTVSQYMKYSSVMNTQSHRETNESYPDLSICLSTYDLLSSNVSYKGRKQFIDYEGATDRFPSIPLKEIFDNTPQVKDLLIACSYRGLQFGEASITLLTKRVYFDEDNKTLCDSLFHVQKFLLEGHTCFRYRKKSVFPETAMESLHHINHPKAIFSLVVDSNILTNRFTLVISDRRFETLYDSVWSPSVSKKGPNVTMTISFIKYFREVLLPPYTNDEFTDETVFPCIHECLMNHLSTWGFVDAGYYLKSSDLHYITSADREDHQLRQTARAIENRCSRDCSEKNTHTAKQITSYVTLVNAWTVTQRLNATEFVITQTEYPVIAVYFFPKTSFFELIIALGSILGIWYGLSAIHLDPSQHLLQRKTISLRKLQCTERQLTLLSNTFYRLNLYFKLRSAPLKSYTRDVEPLEGRQEREKTCTRNIS